MAKLNILLEIPDQSENSFRSFDLTAQSEIESVRESEKLMGNLSGYGIEATGESAPLPMFHEETYRESLAAFRSYSTNDDLTSTSKVITCQIDSSKLESLEQESNVTVWPNSPITLFNDENSLDLASSAGGLDCRPFRRAVSVAEIRKMLAVEGIWSEGFRGQNVVVGIVDEGVNGDVYPVIGGFSRPEAARAPGGAPISSHGSMCAADILVAAPACKLYDYPFLGIQNSGGAIAMFQAILNQRREDGTPHITNNSYGFVGRPPKDRFPRHEVWDINHPVHRKVRELVNSGIHMFFAAGNCGQECPSGACHPSGIGPGKSIHASNSLEEVITVAAVNSRHERIGYSSQGPGEFHTQKPDIAGYSHFFGNFGPGRPAGGTEQQYDNGTSAATPVAAGVGALLMSSFPNLTPQQLKSTLIDAAINLGRTNGWDANTGHGVINAGAAYHLLKRMM